MCPERWRRSTFCTGSGESTAHGCGCHWSGPKGGRPLSSKMRSMSFEAFSVLTSPTSDPTATQRPGEGSRKTREQPGEPRGVPRGARGLPLRPAGAVSELTGCPVGRGGYPVNYEGSPVTHGENGPGGGIRPPPLNPRTFDVPHGARTG